MLRWAGPVWFLAASAEISPVVPVFRASGVFLGSSWLSLSLYLQYVELWLVTAVYTDW